MANIRLKELLEANVDTKLVARSKKTGKLVYFKSPEHKADAIKSGSHEEPKKDKAKQAKQAKASADMFKGDYETDRLGMGGDADRDTSRRGAFDESDLEHHLNTVLGIDTGYAQIDDNTGNIMYNIATGSPTYTLFYGKETGKPSVSIEPTYGNDPSNIEGKTYKRFKNDKDALEYMSALAKKYKKELEMVDSEESDNTDIDVSDVKGKADPDADYFYSDDVYKATFKDPETGKEITVGDAYDREDDSPAYNKAFAYVSKFDPDKEVVMGHPMYGKKKEESTKLSSLLPKK
jgi:hypothetical protein